MSVEDQLIFPPDESTPIFRACRWNNFYVAWSELLVDCNN